MENRGMKRKRYEVMKNDLSVELHKLTIDFGSYNDDVRAATEDFEQLCKSIADRQDDFKSRSLLLQEQYRATLAVLKEDESVRGGDYVGENIVLPKSYAEDARRFALDADTSLKGHAVFLLKEYDEMDKIIKKYEKIILENIEDLKSRAEQIEAERSKLSSALHVFVRRVPEDSDEDEN